MALLPYPFPVPDWSLDANDYPAVFLVDSSWACTPKYTIGVGSSTRNPLTGPTPLTDDENHGEKMLQVITGVTRTLPQAKVTLVSSERENTRKNIQPSFNLPEALLSIKLQLNTGDLVVILVQNDDNNSFVTDDLVAQHIREITDKLNGIVVIAAGNKPNEQLAQNLAPNAVIVGGVDTNGNHEDSRFGPLVTCYGVVPYNLPDYAVQVPFMFSSAATAYVGGMVLAMLTYAKSKNIVLTGEQVVHLLKTNYQVSASDSAQSILADPALGNPGILPDWDKLRPAIDRLRNSAK